MNKKISIIIRTYNEEKKIGEVLESIEKQSYKNFEIIIVDSQSTDRTLDICKKYNTKIVTIKKEDFNYSYASNVGAEYASGEILCYLSGHSIPVANDYLEKTNLIFQKDIIGGCYGDVVALDDGSIWEKMYHYLGYLKNINKKKDIIYETDIHPGILSCSNASIRKDLWEKNRFVEELGHGGEDVELAYRIIQDGYVIAQVPDLLVKHSHGSSFTKFIKEIIAWKKMYKDVLIFIKTSKRLKGQ